MKEAIQDSQLFILDRHSLACQNVDKVNVCKEIIDIRKYFD